MQDQPGHEEYTNFLARTVRARSTIAYGELLDLELAQTCVKLARARIEAARGSAEDRKLEAITLGQRLLTDVFSRWRDLISLTDSVRIPIGAPERAGEFGSPVRDTAFLLIEQFGINSYDATHAATAMRLGAPLLCADAGFADIPADYLTLFTGSRILDRCRKSRAESHGA